MDMNIRANLYSTHEHTCKSAQQGHGMLGRRPPGGDSSVFWMFHICWSDPRPALACEHCGIPALSEAGLAPVGWS